MMPLTAAAVIDQRPAMIPPKIQAALSFVSFCHGVTAGSPSHVVGGSSEGGRALSAIEKRCYDAALTSMTEYFNEDGFGDEPPRPPNSGGNAPVQPQVPVNAT